MRKTKNEVGMRGKAQGREYRKSITEQVLKEGLSSHLRYKVK